MNDLLVTEVRHVSPGDESAEVTLSSGEAEIVAFCHPCSLSVGDRVPNRLFVLDGDAKAPFFEDWPEEEKARLSQERLERIGTWDYVGCGRCLDEERGLIAVRGFIIEMGEVPWDGPIEFEVKRLSL
jgi:hypothetical protein